MSHSPKLHPLDEEMRDMVRLMASTDLRTSDAIVLPAEEIKEKLSKLHCPFTWKPFNDASVRDIMSKIECKLSSVEDEGEEFIAWTTCVLSLILCYEYAQKGAMDYAFEKLEKCEKIVDYAIASDFSVPVMGIGLKHVVEACKIFLLIKSKDIEDATEALSEITQIQDMENRDQASIWSVRGAVFLEYGLKGMKESILFIERALQLDSECGEWHFLLAKALSRVRRIEHRYSIPDEKEIKALEYAVNASENTFYMVLLAHSYVDTSRKVHFNMEYGAKCKSLCNDLNRKALEMFRKASENCKENPYILARCALGFMKLPRPYRNMELANRCVIKCLEKDSTNGFLCFTAAIYYQKQNERAKAKSYFAISAEDGCVKACIVLLRMKIEENNFYDPTADCNRYIDIFKEKPLRETLWAFMATYYYFVKNDFNVALNYWSKVVHSNIHSDELKTCFVPWPGASNPCDIGKTIITEVVMRLDKYCNEEERKTYDEILSTFKKHDLPLVTSVQKTYFERAQSSASQQRILSPANHSWRNMNQNSVENWRVHTASHPYLTRRN